MRADLSPGPGPGRGTAATLAVTGAGRVRLGESRRRRGSKVVIASVAVLVWGWTAPSWGGTGCADNPSFESGTLWQAPASWSTTWSDQPGAPVYPLPVTGPVVQAPCNPINTLKPYARVVGASTMWGTPSQSTVQSGAQSMELWAPPSYDINGGCAANVSFWAPWARVEQTFLLPNNGSNTNCFQFWYAGSFMDAHPNFTGSTQIRIFALCNGTQLGAFTYYDWSPTVLPGVSAGGFNWLYLQWVQYTSPCLPSGCSVTIRMEAYGCTQGGHGCFGYIDNVTCASNCCVPPSPTQSPTATVSTTPSWTPTPTHSATPTNTVQVTSSFTGTRTSTWSRTYSPTVNSPTQTSTATRTSTFTSSRTPTHTGTRTETYTPSGTYTITRTPTRTYTFTRTATRTETYTITPTGTHTPTFTDSPTRTRTATRTETPTATESYTVTETFTITLTFTESSTFTPTPTLPVPFFHVDRNRARAGEEVTFTWRLANGGRLKISIFNSAGEYVATLFDEEFGIERIGSVVWRQKNTRGEQVSSNVYVVRVAGPSFARSARIAVQR